MKPILHCVCNVKACRCASAERFSSASMRRIASLGHTHEPRRSRPFARMLTCPVSPIPDADAEPSHGHRHEQLPTAGLAERSVRESPGILAVMAGRRVDPDLAGTSVLVTGGTSGLGRAMAQALVDAGARVAL